MNDQSTIVSFSPLDLWRASFTRRWHMHPDMSNTDDLICAHQGRCAILVLILFPDASPDLLKAAVTHDMGEYAVGDLAAPFKAVGGDLIAQHRDLEDVVRDRMGFGVALSEADRTRLGLVDRLDAYLFVALRQPHLLATSVWKSAWHSLDFDACRSEVEDVVLDMMGPVGGGTS